MKEGNTSLSFCVCIFLFFFGGDGVLLVFKFNPKKALSICSAARTAGGSFPCLLGVGR